MAPLDRLERLTDLVLVLLNTSRPLTLEELARDVPGYPETRDARRQAFERDKRLLREEGIPIATTPVEGPEQYGYWIDPEAFYLPDLALTPEEQAALHLAVAGVHLGDPSGRDALLKLGASGLAETQPLALFSPPAALAALFEAIRERCTAEFSYREQRRFTTPARLWFGRGHWYLIAWDHDRGAARTFRVDRIGGIPTIGEPGSGILPQGFDPEKEAPEEPWRVVSAADEAEVWLLVDAIEANRVIAEVGEQALQARHEDGSVLLRLGITSLEAMRSWVLGLLDHAEVTAPASIRSVIIDWLEAIAAGEPPPGAPAGHLDPAVNPAPTEPRGRSRADDMDLGGPRGQRRDARQRLRRLLAIVGWLARAGRAQIPEVAQRFGLSERELVSELELAACCGLPPYTPDALMEIVITGETVEASLPEGLARPRRLTAAEGLALATAARTILAVPGADANGDLARALDKLEAALGARRGLVIDLNNPPMLGAVRRACEEGSVVEIEYHSASSDEVTQRVVEPYKVISLEGRWYLDAYCHRAQATRRFRVDRIRDVNVVEGQARVSGDVATPRSDDVLATEAFVPGPGATTVRLVVDRTASWLLEAVPVLEVAQRGEHFEAVLAVGGVAWLERTLLQAGAGARVVDPPEWRRIGPRAARRILAKYRDRS